MNAQKRSIIYVAGLVAGSICGAAAARGTTVTLGASADATLLGGSDALTDNSLADPGIFVGTDGEGNPKRGLIEFDIAGSVPAGATITGVQLQLTVGQVAGSGGGGPGGTTGPETISIYDESQPWGQPTNFAGATTFGGTGHGAAPQTGDATWNYAFYNSTPWTTPGGDWTSTLSDLADASVTGTLANFTWSSPAMLADVQNWLNNPATNNGWILKNADETDIRTFRAFWSAQGAAANNNPAIAPQLTVTYTINPPTTAYWSGAQPGPAGLMWSTASGSPANTNWSATDGGPDLHQLPGGGVTNVIFGAAGDSAGVLTTTLGADFSINSLTFESVRTNPVIIGGANSLTILSGGITVQAGSGAHTVNATGLVLGANQTWTNNSSNAFTIQSNIGDGGAGCGLTTAGSGTIDLAGTNTYSGGTTVTGGSLIIGANGALANGPVTLIGGTLQLGASTGLAAITSLGISGPGTLDISNNRLIVNYGSGPDPIASIVALLDAGYNDGAWNGSGGIDSSAVATNPGYSVGYADSADPGNPAGLASGTLEIAFTLLGDANLDHAVNGVDFGILAANFNKGITGWDTGDFNYDNTVNGVDFGELAVNFNKGAASASDIAALDAFAAANSLMADVPEPGSAAFIAVTSSLLFLRRLRRAEQLAI